MSMVAPLQPHFVETYSKLSDFMLHCWPGIVTPSRITPRPDPVDDIDLGHIEQGLIGKNTSSSCMASS